MGISVIIPVFNAGLFLEESVTSALMQPEVGEVILIEDGSIDHSYEICKKLESTHERVKLFIHEGHQNKGPGISRNLGIEKSENEYIAFLDADDYYLPNRFKRALRFLEEQSDFDGVAEAVSVKFEDDIGKGRYADISNLPLDITDKELKIGLNKEGIKDNLLEQLFGDKNGNLHIGGFLLRKKIFEYEKQIKFSNKKIAQDTYFIIDLVKGYKIKAFDSSRTVGTYRVHCHNRWTQDKKQYLINFVNSKKYLFHKLSFTKVSKETARKMVFYYPRVYNELYVQTDSNIQKVAILVIGYIQLIFFYPRLILRAIWPKTH